jgi:hypothetical protein
MKTSIRGKFFKLRTSLNTGGFISSKVLATRGTIFKVLSEPEYSSLNSTPMSLMVLFIKTKETMIIPYEPDYFELIENDTLLNILYNSSKTLT